MGPGKTPTEDIFTLNNYFKILEAQLKEKYIDFLVFFLMKASLKGLIISYILSFNK